MLVSKFVAQVYFENIKKKSKYWKIVITLYVAKDSHVEI